MTNKIETVELWLRLHQQLHIGQEPPLSSPKVTREHSETNQTPNPRSLPIATSHRPPLTRDHTHNSESPPQDLEITDLSILQGIARISSPKCQPRTQPFDMANRSINTGVEGSTLFAHINQREDITGEEDRRRTKMREREINLERRRSSTIIRERE